MEKEIDYASLCEKVKAIAISAGNYILSEREKFSTDLIEVKSENNFVTKVDKNSERMIIDALKEALPGSGFIAEEGSDNTKGERFNWIIDPLDGTTNFIHGIPCYCVSIALREYDELVIGVIYEINQKECFYSWKGSACYLNGKEIRVSKTKTVKDSLFGTGFPYYDYSRMDSYINLFRYLMKHSHGLRRPGSAAADLAYVAAGRFDGFYEYSLKPWDVAAGIFLVQQAGGKISDFKGGDDYLFGEEIIATNGFIFDEMLAITKKFFEVQ